MRGKARTWELRIKNWNRGFRQRNSALKVKPEWIERFQKCRYCGVELTPKIAGLDHKLPLSRGGKDQWDNLELVCQRDNRAKGSMTDVEFDALVRFLKQPAMDKVRDMVLRKLRAAWRVQ